MADENKFHYKKEKKEPASWFIMVSLCFFHFFLFCPTSSFQVEFKRKISQAQCEKISFESIEMSELSIKDESH